MENGYNIVNEEHWTDERLAERAEHIGQHIVLAVVGSERYHQLQREKEYIAFEIAMRALEEVSSVPEQEHHGRQ